MPPGPHRTALADRSPGLVPHVLYRSHIPYVRRAGCRSDRADPSSNVCGMRILARTDPRRRVIGAPSASPSGAPGAIVPVADPGRRRRNTASSADRRPAGGSVFVVYQRARARWLVTSSGRAHRDDQHLPSGHSTSGQRASTRRVTTGTSPDGTRRPRQRAVPMVPEAAPEHSHTTAAATSSGSSRRPSRCWAAKSSGEDRPRRGGPRQVRLHRRSPFDDHHHDRERVGETTPTDPRAQRNRQVAGAATY
jgi:hypothetical protein